MAGGNQSTAVAGLYFRLRKISGNVILIINKWNFLGSVVSCGNVQNVKENSKRLDEYGYKYSKGTIQIPYSDSLPCELIKEIAMWCDKTGNHA